MTPTVDLRAVASYEPEAVFVAIRKAINAVWKTGRNTRISRENES